MVDHNLCVLFDQTRIAHLQLLNEGLLVWLEFLLGQFVINLWDSSTLDWSDVDFGEFLTAYWCGDEALADLHFGEVAVWVLVAF